MALITDDGRNFMVGSASTEVDKLPIGVYVLKLHPKFGFYLSRTNDFILPKKLYGDFSVIDRWKRSYENNSQKNLGIVLLGLKGTGKTFLCQKFCMDMNMPIILIQDDYRDNSSEFLTFMSNPALLNSIVFIDEFEKIIGTKDEEIHYMLNLMDGNYFTKFIFLFTMNNKPSDMSTALVNRLNRIKYRQIFNSLEGDAIREVVDDMLIYPEHKDSVCELFEDLGMCTFDLLISMIKEINLFNEDAYKCAKYLNLEIEEADFIATVKIHGKEFSSKPTFWNPRSEGDSYYFHFSWESNEMLRELRQNLELEEGVRRDFQRMSSYMEIDMEECEVIRGKGGVFTVKRGEVEYTMTRVRSIRSFGANVF